MRLDLQKLKFGGKLNEVAHKYFAGCFDEDKANALVDSLYAEFVEAAPDSQIDWMRERLKNIFLFATEPPQWIQARPSWPFYEGSPMVFVRQFTVPNTATVESYLSDNSTLYVFGIRVQIENGWRMEYRVIQQNEELRGL